MKLAAHSIGLLCMFLSLFVHAQDDKPKKYEVNGYLKSLQTLYFVNELDTVLFDNLIHNRLNFKWYPNEHITAYVEIRNRIFFGDIVRLIPDYGSLLDVNNDFFDLSFNLVNSNGVIVNTTIDRAYVEYNKNDWEVRVGRQRINWGVNVAWNPNDVFNAYSFFDFDYEERPGSDAIRIKKYTGSASSIEIAANMADRSEDFVMAGMWKTNKWNYDFQLLAGKARNDWVLGAGWAGNIKDAGFKGELTWFQPLEGRENTSFNTVLISAAIDYSFSNTLYLNGSFLINSNLPEVEGINLLNTSGLQRLDSKNLLPYKYATFLQASYNVTPLITTGISWMTFPGETTFFINPTVSISVVENLDADIIGQLFYEKKNGKYQSGTSALFFRMKYSF